MGKAALKAVTDRPSSATPTGSPANVDVAESAALKIATFNYINNVQRRLPVLAWLKRAKPDIVCLQELKAAHEAFPRPRRSKTPVSLRAPRREDVERRRDPGARRAAGADPHGAARRPRPADRCYVAVKGILVASIYLPNGNPQPGPNFKYKLTWFDRLIKHAATLKRSKQPVILAGDYNVVPTDLDIYPTKSWDDDALLQPEAAAAFQRLLKQGSTTPCAPCTPTRRSTLSGTISEIAGRAMPGCGSTTSCSAPASRRAWATPAWTGRCEAGKAPAIMRPPGRSWTGPAPRLRVSRTPAGPLGGAAGTGSSPRQSRAH